MSDIEQHESVEVFVGLDVGKVMLKLSLPVVRRA